MVLASIISFESIIYVTIQVVEANLKSIHQKYCQNQSQNDTSIEFHNRMCCATINYILMLSKDVICIIYSFYTFIDDLYIRCCTIIFDFIRYITINAT